jgi:Domain of unknown function (DUF4333)
MGDTLSTPRDYNQRAQSPDQPTQQGGIPWYQQPVDRPSPPQSPQPPPPPTQAAPYSGAGQYGQPPPPQWTPPSPTPSATTPRSGGSGGKRFLIWTAIFLVLFGAVVAVLLFSGVFKFETKKIAVGGVQTQVQQILVDRVTGYSADDIKDVKCNNGQDPTVKKGDSFNCNVSVRGKQHQLTVTFQDDNGTYEVGLPQLSGGK